MSPKIFWLVSFLSPLPLALLYFYGLLQPHKITIPLIAVGTFCALVLARWDRKTLYPLGVSSGLVYLMALSILAIAIALWSPWIGALALLSFVASFLASSRERFQSQSQSRKRLRSRTLLYLSVPLILVLGFPLGWEDTFHAECIAYSANFSSILLDAINVPHYLEGQTLEFPGHKIVVAQGSGNYNTLLSCLLASLVFFAWLARPTFIAPFYFVTGLFLYIALNAFRITLAGAALNLYSLDLCTGISSAIVQWFTFMSALVLLVSFDALIAFIFSKVSDDTIQVTDANAHNPLKTMWNRLFLGVRHPVKAADTSKLPVIVQLPLLATLIVGFGWQVYRTVQNRNETRVAAVPTSFSKLSWTPNNDFFQLDNHVLESFEIIKDGKHNSRALLAYAWEFSQRRTNIRHSVVIGYPYSHFHDLDGEYSRAGWRLENRVELPTSDDAADSSWPVMVSLGKNDLGEYVFLSYSAIDVSATPVAPPLRTFSDKFLDRILARKNSDRSAKPCLMFHIWTTSDIPFTKSQRAALLLLHQQLRAQLQKVLRTANPVTQSPS